ncbi:MAG TPA: hypothetical protein VKU86_04810 [Acidimicrobiales bacterium]|nr:hypothetical protein [Acidimicrobiales bacterium]
MRPHRSRRDDAGLTLVETAVTCAVIAVVLAAAVPTVSVFFRESTTVQNTYAAVDQLVLASEVISRYVHEAIAPSPGGAPFASATGNAATFYANTGSATGPQEVVAQVVTVGSQRSFKLDLVNAGSGSCPPCTYTGAPRSFVLINYLTNGTAANPLFSYTIQGGGTCPAFPTGSGATTLSAVLTNGHNYSSLSVAPLPSAVATGDTLIIGSGATTQTVTASAGAAQNATSIPVTSFTANSTYGSGTAVQDQCVAGLVGQITAVSMALQATKQPGGQPTGYQSLAYLYSPNYNATVG